MVFLNWDLSHTKLREYKDLKLNHKTRYAINGTLFANRNWTYGTSCKKEVDLIYITSSLAWRQRITTIRNLMELKVLNLLPRSNFFTKAPMFCSGSCLPMSTGIYGYCILLGVAFLIFAAVPGVAGASATLNLAWDKSTSADVAGYQVHYGTSNRNYRHTVDVHKNISCSVSGLEEGETYFFAVTAYDRNRIESDYSNEVAYAIPYPSTPDTPADTDKDGILDSDEISIYETDPTIFDSDKDGLGDGKELAFWGADWRDDTDKDGLVNLKDPDSDGDGYTDGYEISNGWDSADPSDHPESSDPFLILLIIIMEWKLELLLLIATGHVLTLKNHFLIRSWLPKDQPE